jgi:hypothetical protein
VCPTLWITSIKIQQSVNLAIRLMLVPGLRLILIRLRSIPRNLTRSVGQNRNKIKSICLRKPYTSKQTEMFVLPEPRSGIRLTKKSSDLMYQNLTTKGVYPYQGASHILS